MADKTVDDKTDVMKDVCAIAGAGGDDALNALGNMAPQQITAASTGNAGVDALNKVILAGRQKQIIGANEEVFRTLMNVGVMSAAAAGKLNDIKPNIKDLGGRAAPGYADALAKITPEQLVGSEGKVDPQDPFKTLTKAAGGALYNMAEVLDTGAKAPGILPGDIVPCSEVIKR